MTKSEKLKKIAAIFTTIGLVITAISKVAEVLED